MRPEQSLWHLPLSGNGSEDLVSRIGALFTDQLPLCPWQSSLCAMGKGEFKDKLKQNGNLLPAKISCLGVHRVSPTMMHSLAPCPRHTALCGVSPPSSQHSSSSVPSGRCFLPHGSAVLGTWALTGLSQYARGPWGPGPVGAGLCCPGRVLQCTKVLLGTTGQVGALVVLQSKPASLMGCAQICLWVPLFPE